MLVAIAADVEAAAVILELVAAHPQLPDACEVEVRVTEGEKAALDYAVGTLDRGILAARLAVHL